MSFVSCIEYAVWADELHQRNMTWNGKQGFQTPIEDESFIVENMGVFGNMHQERGLTCECSSALV